MQSVLEGVSTESWELQYFDVGPEVYAWLVKAESKGKFVNRLIKGEIPVRAVGR